MQSLSYSELNERQLAQAAYLFADSIFGTDPTAFTYELKENGDVKGRCLSQPAERTKTRAKRGAAVHVTAIEEVNVTEKIIQHAQMNMDALAVSIAQKLYQSQLVTEGVSNDRSSQS